MEVMVIALTNNHYIISQVDEVATEDIGQPDCKLTNPFTLQKDGTLEPWLISVSRQDVFMISSDKIITLTEPMPTLIEKYEELTK